MTAASPRRPASRLRGPLVSIATVALCLLAAELTGRLLSPGASLLRWPNYIVQATAPDPEHGREMRHDPALGHVPVAGFTGLSRGRPVTFDTDGLRDHGRLGRGPVVLAMGDSYTEGYRVEDDATWPAALQGLLTRDVRNGGVRAYGVDQSVLRAEILVPSVKPATLVFAFIGDDIDRTELSVRDHVRKPWFEVAGDRLELHGVPVPTTDSRAEIGLWRRTLGYSYVLDSVLRRLGRDSTETWLGASRRQHGDGERVACLAIARLATLARTHAMSVLVVALYDDDTWRDEASRTHDRVARPPCWPARPGRASVRSIRSTRWRRRASRLSSGATTSTAISPALATRSSRGQSPRRCLLLKRPVRRANSARPMIARVALVLGSILLTLLAFELGLRAHRGVEWLTQWPNLVAAHRTMQVGQQRGRFVHDPLLGFLPKPGFAAGGVTYDDRSFRVVPDAPTPARPGRILALGDSYTHGDEVADADTWPAHLTTIDGRAVINAGVSGFGVDQMVLRGEAVLPSLRPEIVVLSLIADDLRRAEYKRAWSVGKPYFERTATGLELRNVPVPPWPAPGSTLEFSHILLGRSLLVDRVLQLLPWHEDWRVDHERALPSREGEKLVCPLMRRLADAAGATGTRVLVVGQYDKHVWSNPRRDAEHRRQTGLALDCARTAGFATLDTHSLLARAVAERGLDAIYGGWHLTPLGNRLTAEAIAAALSASYMPTR
ncbi:MAG: SGNH/GDSL hydrolase family protein [Alphaproteobacteria bacterium]|nr:SGNH/GDSL hydrolase family protein [Alphaproteobacteria bacterium]